jgi:hypothetical protein
MAYIAVDFDGTCVTHEFPDVGRDIGAAPVLRALVDKGHQLILNTMRDSADLPPAVEWFKEKNIPLIGVNVNPTQKTWTDSPKVFALLYIDDTALGVPLKMDDALSERPFVDWVEVKELLTHYGFL